MSIIIKGGASVDLAGVTTDKELQSRASLFSENNSTGSGVGRVLLSPETSRDYRLRVGTDSILWQQSWENAGNVNLYQNQYAFFNATATQALTTGYLRLNAGLSTTSAQFAGIRSYRSFPMFGSFPAYTEFILRPNNESAQNKVAEFGIGIAPTTAAGATDGAFFRYGTDGLLYAIICANSVEASSSAISGINTNEFHRFTISRFATHVDFWIDDVLAAHVDRPVARALPTNTYQGAVFARVWNTGTASAACTLDLGLITVSVGDLSANRPWAAAMTAAGHHATQTPSGALASGQLTVWANSAAPTAITALSNTALPTGPTHSSLLGGLYLLNLAALSTAVADFIMWGFPNPGGTASVPGRTMMITRVRVSGMIFNAGVTGTLTDLYWGLGYGCTALALNTAEGTGAKAPRRIPIGQWYLPSAAGATAGLTFPSLELNLSDAPVPVNPGEYAHIILRVGTALTAFTAGDIRGSVTVSGYFE